MWCMRSWAPSLTKKRVSRPRISNGNQAETTMMLGCNEAAHTYHIFIHIVMSRCHSFMIDSAGESWETVKVLSSVGWDWRRWSLLSSDAMVMALTNRKSVITHETCIVRCLAPANYLEHIKLSFSILYFSFSQINFFSLSWGRREEKRLFQHKSILSFFVWDGNSVLWLDALEALCHISQFLVCFLKLWSTFQLALLVLTSELHAWNISNNENFFVFDSKIFLLKNIFCSSLPHLSSIVCDNIIAFS